MWVGGLLGVARRDRRNRSVPGLRWLERNPAVARKKPSTRDGRSSPRYRAPPCLAYGAEVASDDARRNTLCAELTASPSVDASTLAALKSSIRRIRLSRRRVESAFLGDRGANILFDGDRRIEGTGLPGGELACQLTRAVRDRLWQFEVAIGDPRRIDSARGPQLVGSGGTGQPGNRIGVTLCDIVLTEYCLDVVVDGRLPRTRSACARPSGPISNQRRGTG